jgi:hypothetical protein
LFHCAFNITSAEFGREFITTSGETIFLITSGIVIVAAALIVVLTKGRLSYTHDKKLPNRERVSDAPS